METALKKIAIHPSISKKKAFSLADTLGREGGTLLRKRLFKCGKKHVLVSIATEPLFRLL